jgi:hypothetical protein
LQLQSDTEKRTWTGIDTERLRIFHCIFSSLTLSSHLPVCVDSPGEVGWPGVLGEFGHQIFGADMVAENFWGALQLQSDMEKRTGAGREAERLRIFQCIFSSLVLSSYLSVFIYFPSGVGMN